MLHLGKSQIKLSLLSGRISIKPLATLGFDQAKKTIEGVAKDLKGKFEKGIGDPEKLLDGKAEDIGNAVKGLF